MGGEAGVGLFGDLDTYWRRPFKDRPRGAAKKCSPWAAALYHVSAGVGRPVLKQLCFSQRILPQEQPLQWATQVVFRWHSSLDSEVDHGCWR
jgi:hypothetical protein